MDLISNMDCPRQLLLYFPILAINAMCFHGSYHSLGNYVSKQQTCDYNLDAKKETTKVTVSGATITRNLRAQLHLEWKSRREVDSCLTIRCHNH